MPSCTRPASAPINFKAEPSGPLPGAGSHGITEGLIRPFRSLRPHRWFLLDLLLEIGQSCLQLRISPLESLMGQVVHDHVGLQSGPLDNPGAIWSIDPGLRTTRHPSVHEPGGAPQPDSPSPGPRSDQGAQSQSPETLRKSFPIGNRVGINQNNHMPVKGKMHVGKWPPGTSLPIHPRLADQAAKNPAVDITTIVLSHVDDETLAIEHGIISLHELRVV